MAIRGQRYPALFLPDVVREALNNDPETVQLRPGIGELENLARRQGEESGEAVAARRWGYRGHAQP